MTPLVKAFRNGQGGGSEKDDPWVQLLNMDRGDNQSFLWMKPDTARLLGNALIDAACWLEGQRENSKTFEVRSR